jgi:hypothetical protein
MALKVVLRVGSEIASYQEAEDQSSGSRSTVSTDSASILVAWAAAEQVGLAHDERLWISYDPTFANASFPRDHNGPLETTLVHDLLGVGSGFRVGISR